MAVHVELKESPQSHFQKKAPPQICYETLLLIGLTIIPVVIWPDVRSPLILAPIVYLLIEGRLRHRTWSDLGFKWRGFGSEFVTNLPYILMVTVVIQLLVV